MSAYAEPRQAPLRRQRALALLRRPLAGGVLWIAVLGGLLAGVVAINVLVLRLNVELDELGRTRAELKADVARLQSRLSSAAAAARIERDARERLGLVAADPETTAYVRLVPGTK
jgi:cell division protein FtsL